MSKKFVGNSKVFGNSNQFLRFSKKMLGHSLHDLICLLFSKSMVRYNGYQNFSLINISSNFSSPWKVTQKLLSKSLKWFVWGLAVKNVLWFNSMFNVSLWAYAAVAAGRRRLCFIRCLRCSFLEVAFWPTIHHQIICFRLTWIQNSYLSSRVGSEIMTFSTSVHTEIM